MALLLSTQIGGIALSAYWTPFPALPEIDIPPDTLKSSHAYSELSVAPT
jgi:hypothetical protein